MSDSAEKTTSGGFWRRFCVQEMTWGDLSAHRDFLYGCSILMIMLFHSMRKLRDNGDLSTSLGLLCRRVLIYGNFGVELFLLLSGISLYFAMQKQPTLRHFYQRRLQRVVLPYLLIAIPWNLWRVFATAPFAGLSLWQRLGTCAINLLGFDLYLTGYRTFWYIYAIVLCYLAYPFLYRLFRKFHWSVLPPLLLMFGIFGVNLLISKIFPVFYERTEVLLQRFPIFILGCYLGKAVFEKRPLRGNPWILFVIMGILTAVIIRGFEIGQQYSSLFNLRAEYFVATLPLLYLLCFAAKVLNASLLYKCIAFLAPITLELYLTHTKLYMILGAVPGLKGNLWVVHILAVPLAILVSLALLRLEKWILKFLPAKG